MHGCMVAPMSSPTVFDDLGPPAKYSTLSIFARSQLSTGRDLCEEPEDLSVGCCGREAFGVSRILIYYGRLVSGVFSIFY
jgi:hypothetical protein